MQSTKLERYSGLTITLVVPEKNGEFERLIHLTSFAFLSLSFFLISPAPGFVCGSPSRPFTLHAS